jgi:hypothetical protein
VSPTSSSGSSAKLKQNIAIPKGFEKLANTFLAATILVNVLFWLNGQQALVLGSWSINRRAVSALSKAHS